MDKWHVIKKLYFYKQNWNHVIVYQIWNYNETVKTSSKKRISLHWNSKLSLWNIFVQKKINCYKYCWYCQWFLFCRNILTVKRNARNSLWDELVTWSYFVKYFNKLLRFRWKLLFDKEFCKTFFNTGSLRLLK